VHCLFENSGKTGLLQDCHSLLQKHASNSCFCLCALIFFLTKVLTGDDMLFSIYASFRWARTRRYILKIGVFVVALSLLSALALGPLVMLFGPLPFLSFPFYGWWTQGRLSLPQPYNYSDRIGCYEAFFLTVFIFQLVPQGSRIGSDYFGDGRGIQVVSYRVVLLDTEMGTIRPDFTYAWSMVFLFFLLINVIGAVLGFGIRKIQILQKTKWGQFGFLSRVALAIVVLSAGIWLPSTNALHTSKYYVDYSGYDGDALAFVMFGIVWLTTIILENLSLVARGPGKNSSMRAVKTQLSLEQSDMTRGPKRLETGRLH